MAIPQGFWLLLDVRAVLLCVVLLLILRRFLSGPKNLPPGPRGFPILGSVPAVIWGMYRGSEPHCLLDSYAKSYGPLVSLKIFHKTVVVLNDYATVKEAFSHPQLVDRPKSLFTEVLNMEGVVASSGEVWVELRRFCLTVLRSFGVGKSSFDEQIQTEAEKLIEEISALDGKPFNPKPLLGNAVSNVICSVIFGKRYEYTDKEFTYLLQLLDQNAKLGGAGGAVIFLPSLRSMPGMKFNQFIANMRDIGAFITNIIDAHRTSFDEGDMKDFTDVYLKEIQQNAAADKSGTPSSGSKPAKYGHLNDRNIMGTIVSLFGAGSETSGTTLQWAILYMMVHPGIQQRVQAEIDVVVGRNRLPRMADRNDLNYTQAVVWEVQRLGCVTPLGVPHCAASDIQYQGYLIPKGTIIVSNLWTIFKDPKLWSDPDQFKPERFLNDEGKAVKPEELIPFSTGRRNCIGEHLAKMELFLFFSYVMHQFTFKKPHNSPPLSLKGKGGFTYSARPFDVCAVKRD